VLDAACGSGSFLIYAYQVLAEFYESERARLHAERLARKIALANAGMLPTEIDADSQVIYLQVLLDSIADYPRLILEQHLYGVDLDSQAAEIAVVNLMMRGMERQRTKKRLPLILNQNVKAGNSLVGLRADDPALTDHAPALARIRALRLQLTQAAYDDDHDRIIAEVERETAALYAAVGAPFANAFHDPDRARPFHWGVEFPEVFYDEQGGPLPEPGFAIILGNPPWEIVKPDLREFYARYDAQIESRLTRAQAEARIAELDAEDPARRTELNAIDQAAADFSAYVKASADYTRQGRGDLGTHKLFLERAYGLLKTGGRLGYVVPSGLYTDLGTKDLREMLMEEGRIEALIGFTNGAAGGAVYFPGVHRSFKISLLNAHKANPSSSFPALFRIDPRSVPVPDNFHEMVSDPSNFITMDMEIIKRFSPESLSVMEFQDTRDYQIAEKIYGNHPLLGDEVEGTWNLDFTREFDMANDAHLFNQKGNGFPLYEGKMIHQFDADFAEPRYWIEEAKGREENTRARYLDWYKGYRFAFREIARGTDERTCISAVLPPRTFAGHTLWVGVAPSEAILLYYVAVINSFCVDWLVRFKGGTHVTLFLMKSLPIPRLTPGDRTFDALVPLAARLVCTRPAFAGLWESVMGGAWSESSGVTDAAARQVLRDQIDGLVAHVYGLSRADYDHILGTFPLVFPPDAGGAARRAAALSAYDAVGGAETG
jgi:hypothetical protein